MAFDGYFIQKMIEEIKPQLLNKRLDRINQNDDFISFVFGKSSLVITINGASGLFYINNEIISGGDSKFLTTLRKHIGNFKLTNIRQYEMDRIIYFTFEGIDLIKGLVKKELILEAFGRNFNIILTEDNRIIEAYNTKHNLNGDMVMQGDPYEVDLASKVILKYEGLNLLTTQEIVNKFQGVSPLLASHLQTNHISLDKIDVVPTKNLTNNQFYWFNLFNDDNVEKYNSLSELLQSLRGVKKLNKNPYNKYLRNEITKTIRKIDNLENDLKTNLSNIKLKNIADSIYSSGLDLSSYCSSFLDQALDINLTLNENAQKFYDIYKKANASISHIEHELKKAHQLLESLKSLQIRLENLDIEDEEEFSINLSKYGFQLKKIQRPRSSEQKVMTINYLGATIYVGRNSRQNEYIVTKIAKNDDMWLHVKGGAGSHVIIKGVVNPLIIEKAAQYAAFHSVYKHSNDIPVDYTLVRYVTKVRKSKTFKTTYTNQKTIFIKAIDQETLTNH